ncbi:DUF2207 domain-containing protein [Methanolapillus ohkumae]|uniref:DUF2207 domain-containing protein n=1 Tax=Methanolapillus ohkumae TaxID=3028298 RepID=A0AA96ZX21_9EURY|nr:hypothetical protein MsAm2_03390 [Methanosarcinaceae archaeon Am2]
MLSQKTDSFFRSSFHLSVVVLLTGFCLMMLSAGALADPYAIDHADVTVTVDESGLTHVHEKIYFTNYGQDYNEVYRLVYTNSDIYIKNATGYIEGYPEAPFRTANVSEGVELIVSLPKPNPEKVVLVLSYDYYGGINVYNDVTEFNFMLWGNNWGMPLDSLNGTMTIAGVKNASLQSDENPNGTVYVWNHPSSYTTFENVSFVKSVTNETITNAASTIQYKVQAKDIPAYTWYDARVIYPRMENPDGSIVSVRHEEMLTKVIHEENEWVQSEIAFEKKLARQEVYSYFLVFVQLFILLIGIATPFYIYRKYGREPKVDYTALYERELPTDTKPAVVNAIIAGHGKPTMDAFVSTIMSLIDNDYISVHETTRKDWKRSDVKDILLKFEKQADGRLESYERDVYNFLYDRADGGQIEWTKFQKKLGENDAFYNFLNRWNTKIEKLADFSAYFDTSGNNKISSGGVILFICSVVMFFGSEILAPSFYHPATYFTKFLCFVSGMLAIVLLIYPRIFKKSMGRWTKDGRVFYLKWKNFEKYLTDYSMIEKYPPSSVIIWDHYLVYAMALGVADQALKNMNLSVPTATMSDSRLGMIYYYPIFYTGMGHAYSASTPQSSNSGGGGGMGGFGGGGIGGGFGGGGGGFR